jgi:chemotaxis protein methyltransferase CheR
MREEDFAVLASLLHRDCGLFLDDSKAEFIASRLKPVAARHGLRSIDALAGALRAGNAPLSRAVIEAVTINDTGFFRDAVVFAALRDQVFPSLLAARASSRHLRIWCCAAATGQEPYSLAMLLDGIPQFAGWTIEIVATDLSPEAIARAKAGCFSAAEVQRGLSVRMLAKYFQKQGNDWRIVQALRNRVQFQIFNLLDPFAGLGDFDLILCRNVLIYFDRSDKADILDRLAHSLQDDGYLVLGASETVLGLSKSFAPLPNLCGIKVKSLRKEQLRALG